MSYTFFGLIILLTGINDYFSTTEAANTTARDPLFSILYGLSCIYLGVASCLFHASHSELWRKADAGMTSGVMAAPLVLGIWDRLRPPAMNANSMTGLALLFQLSLTHGYLPYGSSDILLPTLVALCWLLELHPLFGGAVDSYQYAMWLQCFFGAIGGMILRLADIKRKSPLFLINTQRLYFFLLTIFGIFLGSTNYVVWIGAFFGILVVADPTKGHICWHFASSYALYIWWYMLRVRPGDSATHVNAGSPIAAILVFAVMKNAIRRLFMNFTWLSTEVRTRSFILAEHLFFAMWGWYVLDVAAGTSSWLRSPIYCWSAPLYPFELFYLYYQVKVATHCEDVMYLLVASDLLTPSTKRVTSPNSEDSSNEKTGRKTRDLKMDVHHLATAALCIGSYIFGYSKIGSLVMFLHDVSDLPLDALRLVSALNWQRVQVPVYALTLGAWAYWRLWYFPVAVLYSIAIESKSVRTVSACTPGTCTWSEVPERIPFLLLLGSLLLLHAAWFYELLRKGYRELCAKPILQSPPEVSYHEKYLPGEYSEGESAMLKDGSVP